MARRKTCKECGALFTALMPLQKACSPECALSMAVSIRQKALLKANREQLRRDRERLKTLRDYMKEAQAVFNRYIRTRDRHLPCISCGRYHDGQYHAGHYLSVGSHPELRFEPLNVHKQCAPCNNHLSGNAIMYRKNLVARIGEDKVLWLESTHPVRPYSVDDLRRVSETYKRMTRALMTPNHP